MEEPTSFHQYASILTAARDSDSISRLDSESGIANTFSRFCIEKSQNATDLAKNQALSSSNHARVDIIPYQDSEDDSMTWKLESQTWRLIAMLSSERAQRSKLPGRPSSSSSYVDPYQTPISKVQEILENSTSLSELYTLRNWLSSILPPSVNVEVRKGYKTFTKNRVRNDKRISTTGGSLQSKNQARKSTFNNRGISGVSNLDPDAESRKEGSWEIEDKVYEKALVKALFEYTRSGNLNDALDLSRKVDQSWRSASLSGAFMYYRPGLSFKCKRSADNERIQEEESFGQDDDVMNGIEEESLGEREFGNRNRMLWKGVCRRLATNNNLDPFERALYGSLCGDITSVLNVSTNWIQYLWAYVNHSLETLIDARLDSTNDNNINWWSQNAFESFQSSSSSTNSTEFGSVKVLDLKSTNNSLVLTADLEKELEKENNGDHQDSVIGFEIMRNIFEKLKNSSPEEIRIEAEDPLHQVEQSFIVDEIHTYINGAVEPLKERAAQLIQGTEEYYEYVQAVRFLTHLILFLRLINYTSRSSQALERPESNEAASAIWQRTCNDMLILYIDILKAEKQDDLVAMYASELEAQSATDQYAQYLIAMDLNTSLEDRKVALSRAQAHNLNVAAVASRAVEFSFAQNLPSIPLPNQLPVPPEFSSTSLNHSEESLVKSLDWLSFNSETHLTLLFQANQLIRRFFSRGNLLAVGQILKNLPQDLAAIGTLVEIPKGQLEQFDHFENYFKAIDSYALYKETWSKRPSDSASRIDRLNWEKLILSIIETAETHMTEILELNWLKFEPDEIDLENCDAFMLEELSIIRKIFIPEIVLTLHVMLFESSEVFPSNLSRALQIANLVADERYKLYLEFLSPEAKDNRLRNYLQQVRLTELRALELNSDPFKFA